MKLFLLVLALSSSVFASTRDTKFVTVIGEQQATVELKADRTHTEYRQETQARTCYRQVIVGYQTQCTPPRPNRPGQCRQIPIWQNMPYTCYVTVSVPYEVFDYAVEAKVSLQVDAKPGEPTPTTFKVSLEGNQLSYSATGAPAHIIELATPVQTTTIVGPTLHMIEASGHVQFHEAAPYKAALKMAKASVKKSILTYQLGLTEALSIKHTLKLKKDPIIGSSTVLYEGTLGAGVLSRELQGNTTEFQVAFKDLIGHVLGNGRYSVDISADFGGGEVLNDKELGGLATSKSILYKIN